MLGEIRDKDVADTALSSGLTGHLILSTLHTGNCIETIFLGIDFNENYLPSILTKTPGIKTIKLDFKGVRLVPSKIFNG